MVGSLGSLVITNIMLQSPSLQVNFLFYSFVDKLSTKFRRLNSDLFEFVGGVIKLDSLVYNPPRNGPTIWEIGIPDRLASEFHVPDPYPTLLNKLYSEQRIDKLVQKT